jgi:class I fructose-bisphosphate aldolase
LLEFKNNMTTKHKSVAGLGKNVRLNRLFAHPSGRFCSIAVDHFINYGQATIPAGLRNMPETLAHIVRGKPDAVTMHMGMATSSWLPYAGTIPWILQSTIGRPDDAFHEQIVQPVDAVRLGADAFAVAGFLRGETEGQYIKAIAECVRQAATYEMPVIAHVYPRSYRDGVKISFEPEDIAWAVRCAFECGVDIVKVPFCNDLAAYAQIVSECPVPVVAAGGPKTETFADALHTMHQVVQSRAKGATIGRNVWGFPQITRAVQAMKAVIHDGKNPKEAMQAAGIAENEK